MTELLVGGSIELASACSVIPLACLNDLIWFILSLFQSILIEKRETSLDIFFQNENNHDTMTLKEYYRARGITEADAAKELGFKYHTFYQWVSGTRIPRPAAMRKIVAWSGGAVLPGDFYRHDDETPHNSPDIRAEDAA